MNRNRKTDEIEIIKEILVFKNEYVNVFNDEVTFPSGTQGTYLRITFNCPFSVAVLPIMEDGSITLIETFRHGSRGWGLEVPKGFAEIGETPIEAAARELLEETGLKYNDIVEIGQYHESPSVVSGPIWCFVAKGCKYKKEVKLDKTESIKGCANFPSNDIDLHSGYGYVDAITELLLLKSGIIEAGVGSNG